MGKYSQYESKKSAKPAHKIHPIWTGIGFIMIILVPVVTWAGSSVLVDIGKTQNWPILNSFPRFLQLPDYLLAIPGLYQLTRIDNLPATAILFVLLLVVFSAVFSLVYAGIYQVVGPPRYGPDDIPAPKIKTKPFKR